MASVESLFMKKHVPRLLSRYAISYYQEDDCVEYFLTDKSSDEQVSYALVLSVDRNSKEIHVSRFYPELYKQKRSRFLSAACFYLLIHHFAHCYRLTSDYSISLDTRPATYERFFLRLKDFHFQLRRLTFCETAQISSDYEPLHIDLSMVEKKNGSDSGVPFLV